MGVVHRVVYLHEFGTRALLGVVHCVALFVSFGTRALLGVVHRAVYLYELERELCCSSSCSLFV